MDIRIRWCAALLAITLPSSAACDPPVRPDPIPPGAFLRITGPQSFGPGTTANYKATWHHGNGVTSDVTSLASWSSDPDFISMNPGGIAVGHTRGEAAVVARYEDEVDTWPVVILEPGTFKLTGHVVESGSAFSQGIAGASIEVVAGTGSGLRTMTTDHTGAFALYGVAGDVSLAVTANSYQKQVLAVTVRPAFTSVHVQMSPAEGVAGSLTGRWSLTLQSSGCAQLPPEVRVRNYAADVWHTGQQRLVVKLSGPSLTRSEALIGQVIGDDISIQIPYWPGDVVEFPEYALVEAFGARSLSIHGLIRARLDGATAAGAFEGVLTYVSAPRSVPIPCADPGTVMLRREGL
jgi:hypothetical protein